jgi:hypothetical protein
MYPYAFKIKICDSESGKNFIQRGIGLAENFKEAASKIEHYYGIELVSIEHLEFLTDSPFIFLPEEIFNEVKELANGENFIEETF